MVTYKVLDVLSFTLESRRSIRHHTLTLGCSNYQLISPILPDIHEPVQILTLLTQICLAGFTEFTFLALGSVERNNVISDFDVGDSFSDRFDHTTTLMS